MSGRRVCIHCRREEPTYIFDPHCAAATDRSPFVYCEFVEPEKQDAKRDVERKESK